MTVGTSSSVPGPSLRNLAVSVCALLALWALAPAGVPLVDDDGVAFLWDLDAPGAANVVNGEVTFFLDPAPPRTFDQGPKSHVAARRDAIEAWEIPTSRIRFREDATRTATGHDGGDRVNYVGFTNGGLDPLVLGGTFVTRVGSTIVDMDILLNARDFTWSTRVPGQEGFADVEAVTTHEWGHALGCDHVPLRSSTMYFRTATGLISARSLSSDDLALVGSIYPNEAFEQTRGTLAGRVTRVGATDHRAIHVVAISPVTLSPFASTLTDPDGLYAIEGLPQGTYHVLATPTLPLGSAMNKFWRSGATDFLPSWLTEGGKNPGRLLPQAVSPGATTQAPPFTVDRRTAPLEPNESVATGTAMELGDGVVARFESGGDTDVYSFDGVAGQLVSIAVHGDRLGAVADPSLTLLRSNGPTVATQADVRPPGLATTGADGENLDAALVNVVLPADDTYHVRLVNQGGRTGSDVFYALSVTAASDAPSSVFTQVTATPNRIDAGSGTDAVVTVRPKRESGVDVGQGALVEIAGDGDGIVGAVRDVGDGTYTLLVRSPVAAGTETFDVSVTSVHGSITITGALVLVYLGPVDGSASTVSVTPRRIDADAVAQTRIALVPRDARGEGIGPGRVVVFAAAGPPGTVVTPAEDTGDGVYTAVVQAPGMPGTATVSATVGGTGSGIGATVAFGFELAPVAAQARLDVNGALADPGLVKKAVGSLKKAGKQIDKAVALVNGPAGSSGEKKALKAVKNAVSKLVAALRKGKGSVPDLGAAGELARAIRNAARAALARAVIETGKDQKRVDQTIELLADGQTRFDAGDVKTASKRWLKAYAKVFRLR